MYMVKILQIKIKRQAWKPHKNIFFLGRGGGGKSLKRDITYLQAILERFSENACIFSYLGF